MALSDAYKGTWNFIWEARNVLNGDPNAIASALKKMNQDGALIKFANGSLKDDPVSQAFMSDFKRLVGPLKAAGLKVGGWIYQYLTDVDGEVDAVSQAIDAGADWIVLDAEIDVSTLVQEKDASGKVTKEYRVPKTAEVQEFGQKLRAKYPNVTIGLSSFDVASYHPEVPFDAYNDFVDVMMPQVYWATMGNSVDTAFHLAVASYQKFGKPICPTGQAYSEPDKGIICNPADMARFAQLCKNAGYSHLSWWDWQHETTAQQNAIATNVIPAPKSVVVPQIAHVANDVTADRWSAEAIKWAMDNRIMVGDGQGNFRPTDKTSREELAQALFNAFHQPK